MIAVVSQSDLFEDLRKKKLKLVQTVRDGAREAGEVAAGCGYRYVKTPGLRTLN